MLTNCCQPLNPLRLKHRLTISMEDNQDITISGTVACMALFWDAATNMTVVQNYRRVWPIFKARV